MFKRNTDVRMQLLVLSILTVSTITYSAYRCPAHAGLSSTPVKQYVERDVATSPSAQHDTLATVQHLLPISDNQGVSTKYHAVYNFGTVSALDDAYVRQPLSHTFVLKNEHSFPITVSEIKPDCVCGDGKIVSTSFRDYPFIVAENAEVQISVWIDPTIVFPGKTSLSVDVFAPGQAAPLATLTLVGSVDSGISFSKPVLQFGHIESGKTATQLLTLRLDKRMPRHVPNIPLEVTSTNPDVTVARVLTPVVGVRKNVNVIMKNTLIFLPQLQNLKDDYSQTYRVVLSPTAALGRIKGKIRLAAIGFPNLLLFANAYVPFDGWVGGDIGTSQNILVFGDVPRGTIAIKKFLVQCNSMRVAHRLRATCRNRAVSVSIINSAIGDQASTSVTVQIIVSISHDAPVGLIEDPVVVTTANKQYLRIPLVASITSGRSRALLLK